MYVDGTKMLIPLEDGIGNVIAKTNGTPILPLWVESVQCWQEEWEILRVLNYGKLQTQAGNPYCTSQVVNIRLMIQGIYLYTLHICSVHVIYCTCIILQLNDMRFRAELNIALNSLTSRTRASYSSKKPFLALRLAGDSHLHGTMILF